MARSHRSRTREAPRVTQAAPPAPDEAAFLAHHDPWWRAGMPRKAHGCGSCVACTQRGDFAACTFDAQVVPTLTDLAYDDWEAAGFHVTYS